MGQRARAGERRPRLVATDLDGTLLDPRGEVTERTRLALQHAWTLGVETVFVTARPPRWIDALAEWVGGHGVAICANGAFRYDVASRCVTQAHGLAPEVVAQLAAEVREAVPDVGFAAELASGFHHEPAYPARRPVPAEAVRAPIEAVAGQVGKLLARSPSRPDPEFLATVARVVGERGIVAFSGAGGLAEIGPPRVTKASALREFCASLGIDARQVWAFGDMPNDVPMLAWAGRAFAMGNAHPEALAAADVVCASNDEDGVARELERIA